MSDHLSAEHWKVLKQELLVSTAINALLPAAVIWLLDVTPPQTLFGDDSILGAILPASGLATLVMTVVLTMILRMRLSKGAVPALDVLPLVRFVPRHLALRAVTLAVLAMVLLVPAALGFVAATGVLPFTKMSALLFNIGFGTVVGLVMTPFVVLAALADGRRA